MDSRKIKKFVLNNLAYVIFGYAGNIICFAFRTAEGKDVSEKLLPALNNLGTAFAHIIPSFHPVDLLVGIAVGVAMKFVMKMRAANKKKFRQGTEYGSAVWGTEKDIEPYMDFKEKDNNVILTQTEGLTMGKPSHPKYARNKNILVIGGSGSGKTRFFVKPNLMQMHSSYIVTDPKGTVLIECGKMLERGRPVRDEKGNLSYQPYRIKVFNTIDFGKSMHYNPFAYISKKNREKDILKFVDVLIKNTQSSQQNGGDDFWVKAEKLLYTAYIAMIFTINPPEEQNFAMIMEMLGSAQVKEEDEDYESPLDILFDRLEMRDPDSIAVKQYHIYKQAAGKTAKSILISVGVRLAAFNLPQIAKLTNTDELDLSSMGERKVALFCCIPDADTSLNYLVGMIYSQLFQTLYYMADRVHGGALPVPVNCIMDEFPNVSLPNEFEKILATCRSRSIYCSIIIQNMSQLKALFKDSWESLVGNCDEFLYLGGNEKETHKYVSELLGKETIDTNTYGQTKGKSGSYSTNFQQSGRELLQPDEVRMLDNQNALLFIRGERPILDAKYDLMKHPNIRYTEDGGAGPFNYAKAPLAHDDFMFDETRYDDYELLLDEDIIGELF